MDLNVLTYLLNITNIEEFSVILEEALAANLIAASLAPRIQHVLDVVFDHKYMPD